MCINPRRKRVSTTPVEISPFNDLYLSEGFEDGGFDVLAGKPAVKVNQAASAPVYFSQIIPVYPPAFKEKGLDELIDGRIFVQLPIVAPL